MSRRLPVSEEDMLKIKSITTPNNFKYQSLLLDVTRTYEAAKAGIMKSLIL